MKSSSVVLAGLLMAALVAPAEAQLQGRDIDLNQKQGRIGWEQFEYLLMEGKTPPGFGGFDGPPPGLPKLGDDKYGKPDDQVTSLLDDPSEQPPDPKAKSGQQGGGEEPAGGEDGDFEGGGGPEKF